jgi:pre-mRNA-splicing factor 38B
LITSIHRKFCFNKSIPIDPDILYSYIRAIGFLYLRYVCAPAQLWDWFQYYLEDEEEITISSGQNPTKITIGKLCRMLITEQKFQGTMLPRIPVPIARDLEKKLKDYDREKRRYVYISMMSR